MVSIDAENIGPDDAAAETSVDVPEADLVEEATSDDDESPQNVPLEVNPADAVEQHRSVPDDEDYPRG
ncbi:hypothetical protein [Prescottella sp. R16]|uniref:hypothetical protein n=1 Tax=Prescottella sp. R16 TaxID=3064529 RepID=UPI00272EBA0E|nr:hypothetical protein [Prescottella sp. R16]